MTHTTPFTITHNVVDSNGKVLSSIVQHSDGKKITMTNADGATVVMDGPNLTHKPGKGGKVTIDGDVAVNGGLSATKTIAGQAVTSGGLPVVTG
jgi:hypothetical protein